MPRVSSSSNKANERGRQWDTHCGKLRQLFVLVPNVVILAVDVLVRRYCAVSSEIACGGYSNQLINKQINEYIDMNI